MSARSEILKNIFILLLCGFVSPVLAASVIDGDTLKIDGVTYRLNGIDAPEHGQKCMNAAGNQWPCGKEATEQLKNIIGSGEVYCLGDETGEYQRIIATCYVGNIDLNKRMVELGFAWAFRKYTNIYVPEEEIAQKQGIGIWQAETMTAWDFRAERWEVAAQTSPDGCPIKGNINNNVRIYHTPWSPWYTRTKVSIEKGERWFCDEAQAIAAGWRAPYWGN